MKEYIFYISISIFMNDAEKQMARILQYTNTRALNHDKCMAKQIDRATKSSRTAAAATVDASLCLFNNN